MDKKRMRNSNYIKGYLSKLQKVILTGSAMAVELAGVGALP